MNEIQAWKLLLTIYEESQCPESVRKMLSILMRAEVISPLTYSAMWYKSVLIQDAELLTYQAPSDPAGESMRRLHLEFCNRVAESLQSQNGEHIPTTVHAPDPTGILDPDDPRLRECTGCGEVVSCKCGSD